MSLKWRILKTSWLVSLRSKKRLISFVIIYGILITWMSITLEKWRWESIEFIMEAGFVLLAGSIVAILYGFILSYFRQIEVATLKCLGWDNNDIRTFIIGEIIFVTLLGFLGILEISFHFVGVLFYFLGPSIASMPIVQFVIFPVNVLILSFATIMLAQVPGILLATWKILTVSPMIALRKAK
ncbi:MAG: hypothetical protein ACP6IU_03015 [Candidatus Asgardarchaeia archaeon]